MSDKQPSEPSGSERRSVSRINSLNFVSYSYFSPEFKTKIEDIGRTMDISLGGIKLEIPSARIPASEVELHIALEEALINVKGQIAHVKNFNNGCSEVGVRFINISNGDKLVLEKFLRSCRGLSS